MWNVCHWGADVPPGETSLTLRSKEKGLYPQARGRHGQSLTWLLKHVALKSITHPSPCTQTQHTYTAPPLCLPHPPSGWVRCWSSRGFSIYLYTCVIRQVEQNFFVCIPKPDGQNSTRTYWYKVRGVNPLSAMPPRSSDFPKFQRILLRRIKWIVLLTDKICSTVPIQKIIRLL